jgi:hypothetical protein
MSTDGPAPEQAVVPEAVPAVVPDVATAGPAGAAPVGAGLPASALAGDPRAGLTPERVVALSVRAGNAGVARMLAPGARLQRQGTPATAPPQPAPAGGPPAPGGMTPQQAVILSAAITDVSNSFNNLYLAQKTGLDNLRRDMEKKNEPGLGESVIWAIVDAALGMGVKKVTEMLIAKVGAVAVDKLKGPVTLAINQAGATLTPDSHEPVFSIAIEQAGKAHATAITTAAGGWASGKVTAGAAAVRTKVASDLEEIQQFLTAQELTLIEHLADRQGELTSTVAPALTRLPFAEAMTAAVAMREAAGEARREADILQYLSSSSAWAGALAGGSAGREAALAQGARGVLFVRIPNAPEAEFSIVSAKIEGMPDDMKKRLRSTDAFKARSLADWPLPKVIQNDRLYLAVQANAPPDAGAIRLGHDWLASRGKAKYGMEGGGPAIVPAALLFSELQKKTIADLPKDTL